MFIFDKTLELAVKSLFFSLRNYIIFTAVYVSINSYYAPGYLLIATIGYYALCFPACRAVIKDSKLRSQRVKVLLVGFVGVSGLLSALCLYTYGIGAFILGFVYFFAASFDVVKMTVERTELSYEIRKSLIALAVMLVLTVLLNMYNSPFADKFYEYLLLYFLVGTIYIARINFAGEYNTKYYDTVNKSKNMFSFNVITVVLVLILFFIKDGFYGIVKFLFGIANRVVSFVFSLLEGILNFFVGILLWLLETLIELFAKYITVAEAPAQIVEEQTEQLVSEATTPPDMTYVELFFKAVGIIIILFIVIKIGIYIYKNIMKYIEDISDTKDEEEKSFMFSGKDMLRNMKNKLAESFKKKEELSQARRIYKDTVNQLIDKGYFFEKHITPNEYICCVLPEMRQEFNLDKITSNYNDSRYGN